VYVNPTQVCVNPTQVYVNPTQVYVNPTQVCVNPTQVSRVAPGEGAVLSVQQCGPLLLYATQRGVRAARRPWTDAAA
jgi:hypothetical protein